MGTKIDILRREFLRIGCPQPRDPFEPRLYVGWHYTEIFVSGIYERTFDYDILCMILQDIPDGAGEEFFWARVRATNFEALVDRFNRGLLAANVH